MKTIEIKNLQPQIQELDDSELSGVVGGGFLDDFLNSGEDVFVSTSNTVDFTVNQTLSFVGNTTTVVSGVVGGVLGN